MSTDIYCDLGMHLYCDHARAEASEATSEAPQIDADELADDDGHIVPTRGRGRPIKTEGFKDLISTGRKRAAKLYAIQPGQVCEWAWKKNCGGGVKPVTGCSGRKATNIHHGPDKSVLNNRPDNVSVICPYCHNLWHDRNDSYYGGERPVNGEEWLPVEKYSTLDKIEDAEYVEVVRHETSMERPIDLEETDLRWNSKEKL